jgi:hypothetical protein
LINLLSASLINTVIWGEEFCLKFGQVIIRNFMWMITRLHWKPRLTTRERSLVEADGAENGVDQ